MKKYILSIVTLTTLIALATAPSSFGAVLIADDFESYTLGTTPTNPGDGNLNNWFFNSLTDNEVVSGSSPDGEAPNAQVLHVEGTNVSSFGRQFAMQDGTSVPGTVLTLAFKLQIGALTGHDYYIQLLDNTLGSGGNPINIRIAQNGSVFALTRTVGPGSGSATNSLNSQGDPLAIGPWYQFTINADLNAQTYDLDIMNLETGVGGSTGPLFFYYNTHTLNELRFKSLSPANPAVNWNLNDVNVTVVPEPTTAMAVLLGVGLLAGGSKGFRLLLRKKN